MLTVELGDVHAATSLETVSVLRAPSLGWRLEHL
jgi:hypothetical protein